MSNKLEDLVPPLELCKKIPAGEFEDSALVWHDGYNPLTKRNFTGVTFRPPITMKYYEEYPAPTLQEILDSCKDIAGVLNPTVWYQCGNWVADCAVDKSGKLGEEFLEDADFKNLDIVTGKADSPVIAALKLWLKLKGIEA